jgi:hypothetical protein
VCSTTTSTSCTTNGDCPIGEECLNGPKLPECSGGQCFSVCGEKEMCHCGRCDGDTNVGCTTNADCGVDGPCAKHTSVIPEPNSCSDHICTPLGPGRGECEAGTSQDEFTYCDGIVFADGTAVYPCDTNADCEPVTPGSGSCTIVKLRSCYPDVISLTGTASTTDPVIVSAACDSPSKVNPAANPASGYPGPGVRREKLATVFRCAGNPSSLYPGCP